MKDFFQYIESLTEAKFKLPKNKDVYYNDYVGDYPQFEMELGDDYTDVNMSMKDLKKITPATLKGMSKSELEKIAEVIEEDEDILATMIDLLPQLISNEWDVFDEDDYDDEVKYLKKWQKTLKQHDKLNNQKYKVVEAELEKAK